MTIAQAKKLKVGDYVHLDSDPTEVMGEIHDTGYRGVTIKWPGFGSGGRDSFQTLYFDNPQRWENLTNPWAA